MVYYNINNNIDNAINNINNNGDIVQDNDLKEMIWKQSLQNNIIDNKPDDVTKAITWI